MVCLQLLRTRNAHPMAKACGAAVLHGIMRRASAEQVEDICVARGALEPLVALFANLVIPLPYQAHTAGACARLTVEGASLPKAPVHAHMQPTKHRVQSSTPLDECAQIGLRACVPLCVVLISSWRLASPAVEHATCQHGDCTLACLRSGLLAPSRGWVNAPLMLPAACLLRFIMPDSLWRDSSALAAKNAKAGGGTAMADATSKHFGLLAAGCWMSQRAPSRLHACMQLPFLRAARTLHPASCHDVRRGNPHMFWAASRRAIGACML